MNVMNDFLGSLDSALVNSGTFAALRIVLILTAAWIAIALLRRAILLSGRRLAARLSDPEAIKRAETLGRVFNYLVAIVVGVIAGMMVMSELGISLAPVLGAAGVAGVAIGFGAQSLVKDFFSGFFILFEDQIRKGDVIRVAGHAGLVEEITLRHTRLRDYDGNVHYVPNGMIESVVNMSRSFAHAVIDVGVAYREDVEEVFALMRRVGVDMRADTEFGPRILEELEIAGVDRWDDSAVVLRCRFKVAPLEQWAVRREYLRRLKKAFDEAGVEIPYPHLTVYAGIPKKGSAPAFRMQTLSVQ